jgi:hypothetical protein
MEISDLVYHCTVIVIVRSEDIINNNVSYQWYLEGGVNAKRKLAYRQLTHGNKMHFGVNKTIQGIIFIN